MKKWIDIEGAFLVDIEIDEFCQELINWLTAKGWMFAGVTNESDEEVPEELQNLEEGTELEQIYVNPNKKAQH